MTFWKQYLELLTANLSLFPPVCLFFLLVFPTCAFDLIFPNVRIILPSKKKRQLWEQFQNLMMFQVIFWGQVCSQTSQSLKPMSIQDILFGACVKGESNGDVWFSTLLAYSFLNFQKIPHKRMWLGKQKQIWLQIVRTGHDPSLVTCMHAHLQYDPAMTPISRWHLFSLPFESGLAL